MRLASDAPSSHDLLEVCQSLSLKAELRSGKHYPRSWWEDAEPLFVETAGTKSKLLRHLGMKLRELRQSKQRKVGEPIKKYRAK